MCVLEYLKVFDKVYFYFIFQFFLFYIRLCFIAAQLKSLSLSLMNKFNLRNQNHKLLLLTVLLFTMIKGKARSVELKL